MFYKKTIMNGRGSVLHDRPILVSVILNQIEKECKSCELRLSGAFN